MASSSDKSKVGVRLAGAFGILLLLVLVFLGLRWFARTPFGLILLHDKVPTSLLVQDLSHHDRIVVMTALNSLEERRSPAGREEARRLLSSDDDYVWLNAATYLAALQDGESIPWLIKALKHPAWRSVGERVAYLQELTGQSFGRDQERWIAWWRKAHPDSSFEFRFLNLEAEAARLPSTGGLLINAVVDALTIGHVGPTIRLIGIRPKRGLEDPEAIRLLQTLVMGQFVQLRFDNGPKLDEKGDRRAFPTFRISGEALF